MTTNETEVTITHTIIKAYSQTTDSVKTLDVFGGLTVKESKEMLKDTDTFISKEILKDTFTVDSSELLKLKK